MKKLNFKNLTCDHCGFPYGLDQDGNCIHCGVRLIPAAYRHNQLDTGAVISDCGTFRYKLWRIWDHHKPKVLFIMLNPSTADAVVNDRTIGRCIGYAESWGYGGFYVCNLFAFRSKTPTDLLKVADPIGPDNDKYLRETAQFCEMVVCAWGNSKIVDKLLIKQGKQPLKDLTNNLYYLELSKDGTPKHPLYLLSDLKPVSF